MTLIQPERTTDSALRRAAEQAEEATGFRAEIIRGVLMMSPSPRGLHAGIINRLYDQLRPVLGDHLEPFQVASVAMPDDADDYATPDLMVLPTEFGESDDWLADPADVELVVEVVSKSNSVKDTRDMVEWYAAAGIAVYLLIDPRNGTWILRSQPQDGKYQQEPKGVFGDDITLPGLDIALSTTGFPQYGS